jgi:hypothetical protein
MFNSNRAARVLRNITSDCIATCAAMARARPVTENIMPEMLVITRMGIKAADRAIAVSGIG